MSKLSTSGGDLPKSKRWSSADSAVTGDRSSKTTSVKRVSGATGTSYTPPSPPVSNSCHAGVACLRNWSGVGVDDEPAASLSNGHQRRAGKVHPGKRTTATAPQHKPLHGSRLPTTTMTRTNGTGTGNGCIVSESTASSSSSEAASATTDKKNDDTTDDNNNSFEVKTRQSRRRRSNIDELLRVYFPVTLRVSSDATNSRRRRSNDAIIGDGAIRPHQSQNPSCSSGPRRIRSAGSRQSSTRSSSSSTSNSSFDRIYLAAMDEARLGSPPILQSSPYEDELVQLRLKMLRMEEDRHLEHRQIVDEAPRSCQPQQLWYATKTVEYHREAQRNNQHIAHMTAGRGSFRCKPSTSAASSALVLDVSAMSIDSSPASTLTPARAALFASLCDDHR